MGRKGEKLQYGKKQQVQVGSLVWLIGALEAKARMVIRIKIKLNSKFAERAGDIRGNFGIHF